MSEVPGIPNPPSDEIPDPLLSSPAAEEPTMASALPEVSTPEPAYVPPVAPPPPPVKKKTNTGLIIAIVVLVVLCCCCIASVALAWNFGDMILNNMGFYY